MTDSWEDDDWEAAADGASDEEVEASDDEKKPSKENSFSDEDEAVVDDITYDVETSKPRDENKPAKAKKLKLTRKEIAAREAKELALMREAKPMTAEEKMAEKLRQQKLVEEADLALTMELLGKSKDGAIDEEYIAASLGKVPLVSQEDYSLLAKSVAKRLEVEDNAPFTKEFLKVLVRGVSTYLSADDLKEIDSVLNVIKSEKVKVGMGKKKKKNKKVILKMKKGFDLEADHGYSEQDNYDAEYDFM